MKGRSTQEKGWAATALLASAYLSLSILSNHPSFLDLARYAAGQAAIPYQYRTLMAWLLRLVGGSPLAGRLAHRLPPPFADPYLLTLLATNGLALVATVFAVRRTLELLTRDAAYSRWASLLVLYLVAFHFALPYGLSYFLPYDLPSVLAFAVAFYALVARRRALFALTFVVGTINRETTLFLLVPWILWELYDARGARVANGARTATLGAGALLAFWVVAKLAIAALYAGRPPQPDDGGLFETHLRDNLVSLLKPTQWPLFASLFGFTLPVLYRYRTQIDDFRLRRSLEILLPLWAGAMFVVGVLVEVRIFGELVAPVALGLALIAHRLVRTRESGDAPADLVL